MKKNSVGNNIFVVLLCAFVVAAAGCSSSDKPVNEEKKVAAVREEKSSNKADQADKLMQEAKRMFAARNFQAAIDLCNKVIGMNPAESEAFYCLGNGYGRIGNNRKAINSFQQFLNRVPNNYEAHYNIATAYAMIKDYNNALLHFKRSVEIEDKFSQGYFGLGLTYFKVGQKAKAMQTYRKLQSLNRTLAAQLKKLIN